MLTRQKFLVICSVFTNTLKVNITWQHICAMNICTLRIALHPVASFLTVLRPIFKKRKLEKKKKNTHFENLIRGHSTSMHTGTARRHKEWRLVRGADTVEVLKSPVIEATNAN